MNQQLRALWPTRPLKLRAPVAAWRAWLLLVIAIGFGAGILAWIAIALVPGILDDFSMRDRAQPVPMSRVENGRCRSKLAIIHSCEATLVATTKEGVIRRDVEQMFFDLHTGNWTVRVMADPARPGILTTDVALDRIWHRIATAIVFTIFGLLMLFAFFGQLRRRLAEGRRLAALSGQLLFPVPLTLQSWNNQRVTLTDSQGRASTWSVLRDSKLFTLADGRILGVTLPGGEAFPLDDKLRWVELPQHERAALLAARTQP